MIRVKGVYERSDGRWEARYVKGYSENGKKLYGAVYGASREEVIERRKELVGDVDNPQRVPTQLNLLILGAGSHGRNVMEIAESLRVFSKINFLDDSVTGERILGKCNDVMKFRNEYSCAFVAIGDNDRRKKFASFLKERNFLTPSIISPLANISTKAKIGEGTVILPQSTVNDAEIGNFCIFASNSLINIDTVIGSYSHVDCGGIVMKNAKVPEGTLVKSGEIYISKSNIKLQVV